MLAELNTDSGNINFLTDNPLRRNEGCLEFPRILEDCTDLLVCSLFPGAWKHQTCCTCASQLGSAYAVKSLSSFSWIFQVFDVTECHTCTEIYLILPQLSGMLYRHMLTIKLRFIHRFFQEVVYSLCVTCC